MVSPFAASQLGTVLVGWLCTSTINRFQQSISSLKERTIVESPGPGLYSVTWFWNAADLSHFIECRRSSQERGTGGGRVFSLY